MMASRRLDLFGIASNKQQERCCFLIKSNIRYI